jgi:hypothetical protein
MGASQSSDNTSYCHKIDSYDTTPSDGFTVCKYDTSLDIKANDVKILGSNHRCPQRMNENWIDSSNDSVNRSGLGCVKL